MTKNNAIAWLIGYFVVLAPINYAVDGGVIWALCHSIIGLVGAIYFYSWRYE